MRMIEFLHCMHQPQVSLFNKIFQRHASVHIATRDFHHQTEISIDHPLPGLIVTGKNLFCQLNFLISCQ